MEIDLPSRFGSSNKTFFFYCSLIFKPTCLKDNYDLSYKRCRSEWFWFVLMLNDLSTIFQSFLICVQIQQNQLRIVHALIPGNVCVCAHKHSSTLLFCDVFVTPRSTKDVTSISKIYEPRCEKTGLRGFRPGPTQTGLYSH